MKNYSKFYMLFFGLILSALPNLLTAQCSAGQTYNSYCYAPALVDAVAFEFCPTAGMAAQSTIIQGSFFATIGDNLTVYSGSSGSGTGGTIVFGPSTGNVAGNTFASLGADQCLIFIINSNTFGVPLSCVNGTELELQVCSESITTSSVSFTALDDLCINAGVQSGLGNGFPTGGVYSGPGVTDNGDGMTYSFDPAAAGVGVHTLVYTNGGTASDFVEVFATGTATFTALPDLCIDAGTQTGLGGGAPAGGTYSGPGVTDNGNGTYDFDPAAAGLGMHTITYTESGACMNVASDMVEVLAACGCPASFSSSHFHCSAAPEVDLVIFEVCPSAGMAAQATIMEGTYNGGIGNNLSVYEGTSGSGTSGVLVAGSLTGDLTGMVIMGNGADNCLIFVSNVPALGCSTGDDTALKVCGEDIASSVTYTALADICIDDGVQTGLSGGLSTGGVYSGPGVTDNGDGMTYSFDPAAAGVGTHTLTYTESGSAATDDVEVFATGSAGCVAFIALDDLCINAGVQSGLGGGTPVGGVYGGPGVTDNGDGMTYSFDPAAAGIGGHILTYTSGGNVVPDDVTVFALPTVTLNITTNTTLCIDAAVTLYNLTGAPTGGVYSGTGVTNLGDGSSFTFNPANAGVGTHTVTYTFTDGNGCTGSATDDIQVVGPSTSFSALPDLCVNAGVQAGLGGGSPSGGIFSGPGVTDNGNSTYDFDPAMAGVGVHTIMYSATDGNGCTGTASDMVEVFPLPTVMFTAPADLCLNAGVQMNLSGGTLMGGVYSGTGVTDDGNGMTYSFDPAAAGIGVHTITYDYTDANGCTGSASDMVEVFGLPVVTFEIGSNSTLCLNDAVTLYTLTASPNGGVFSGSGVTNLGDGISFTFNPATTGVGTHTVTYNYTDGNGCSNSATDNITVLALPIVVFTAPPDLCIDAGVQMGLDGGTPPQGTVTEDMGIYSGAGVSDDGNGMTYSFDPAMAGVGVHTLTYTYTDENGCSNSASDDIEVFALPTVMFTALADICVDATVQTGLGNGTPMGGVYSGPGVIDDGNGMTYIFEPATAGVGVHTITYDFTDANGCSNSASDMVEVFALPTVSFMISAIQDEFCINGGIQTIGGGSPTGGVYSGAGVVDDGNGMTFSFDPATAGVGTHTVTYTYTDASGCVNSATDDIIVQPIPPATFTVGDIDGCEGNGTCAGTSTLVTPMSTSTGGGGNPIQFWSETFDEDGVGVIGTCTSSAPSSCATNTAPSNGQWSVTGNVAGLSDSDDFFRVDAGQLEGQDIDAEICFLSEVIDISSYSSVDFSVLLSEEGDLEVADYMDVTLIIDGVPMLISNWMSMGNATHTLIGDQPDDDDWVSTTVTSTGITGSTLQIEICAFHGASTENMLIDNVTLIGTTAPNGLFKFYDADPAGGSATLLAGPAASYDPMTTAANSPQSIWVVECLPGVCDSDAEEVVITIVPNPTPTLIPPTLPTGFTCLQAAAYTSAPDATFDNGLMGACENSGTVMATVTPMFSACGGSIEVSYSGMDNCGNMLTAGPISIPVDAAPVPTVTPPSLPTAPISCLEAANFSLENATYTNGLAVPCLISGEIMPTIVPNFTTCGGIITVSFSGTDICNNVLSAGPFIIAVSPAPAATLTIPNLPSSMSCDMATTYAAPDATYDNGLSGICENSGSITGVVTPSFDACGGTLTVNYNGTDDCGNALSAGPFTILVLAAPIPTITIPTLPTSVSCENADAYVPPSASFDNGLSGICNIAGSVSGVTNKFYDECGGVLEVIYFGKDECGRNIPAAVTTIPVDPAPAPTLDIPTYPSSLTCAQAESLVGQFATYSNGLEGICQIKGFLAPTILKNVDACDGGTVNINYAGQDDCGNVLSAPTITILVTPAMLPTIQLPDDPSSIYCWEANNYTPGIATFSNGENGFCENSGELTLASLQNFWDDCDGGYILYQYDGYDNCGNFLQSDLLKVIVNPDTWAPQGECSEIVETIEDIKNTPTPNDLGGYLDLIAANYNDYCGEVIVTIIGDTGSPICGLDGTFSRVYEVEVSDDCGNVAGVCSITFAGNCNPLYCTLTEDFYGSDEEQFGGFTAIGLINELIDFGANPIQVGIGECGLSLDNAACIQSALNGEGQSISLPSGFELPCGDPLDNNLVNQIITTTLNIRYNAQMNGAGLDFGNFQLDAACMYIPVSISNGLPANPTVNDLIIYANNFIGCQCTGECGSYNTVEADITNILLGLNSRFNKCHVPGPCFLETTEPEDGVTIFPNTGEQTFETGNNADPIEVNIFPNPANDILNVEIKDVKGESTIIDIFDVRGRKIGQQSFFSLDQNIIQLDVERLPSGMYWLVINVDGFEQVNKKFIIKNK